MCAMLDIYRVSPRSDVLALTACPVLMSRVLVIDRDSPHCDVLALTAMSCIDECSVRLMTIYWRYTEGRRGFNWSTIVLPILDLPTF